MRRSSYILASFVVTIAWAVACAAPYREPLVVQPQLPPVNWKAHDVTLDVNGKSWAEVLKWFSQQTRLSLVTRHELPLGKLVLNVPHARANLSEIFDLLNTRLQAEERLILARSGSALYLLPAEEKLPPHLIPRVDEAELPDRPQTEIVEVVITLGADSKPEEVAPHAKRLLGAFGGATALPNNRLLLRSDVATLRKVLW